MIESFYNHDSNIYIFVVHFACIELSRFIFELKMFLTKWSNTIYFFRNPDRRSKLISAPSNFNHISHMGPGDGIQIQRLMDLPTTLETAEPGDRGGPSVAVMDRDARSHSQTKHTSMNQASSGISLVSQQNPMNQVGVQRVKSLLQTSAKLPSRLPPGGHSGPLVPQRSVSHNEVSTHISYLNSHAQSLNKGFGV